MLLSLTQLKAQLLPPALRSRTDFDAQLTTLADGVQLMMERYCARKFLRTVGAVEKFSANNEVFSLSRFPLESISSASLVTASGDTTAITADIQVYFNEAGLVHFSNTPGAQLDIVSITFTGGYWWDASDAQDGGSIPNGATALPADLKLAYVSQIKAVCEAQNLFGTAAAGSKEGKITAAVELLPLVKEALNPYRKF